MDLNGVVVFVRVIQAGSFSRAAKQMEMPLSTVSAKVAALERNLGASLIQRTTRRLRLTKAGEIYFNHAVRAVTELQTAESLTQESKVGIQGLVRITAPVEIGMSSLADCLSTFLANHPAVEVDLVLTDRVVDLVAEGIDIALRIGDLKDSSLISKRIGTTASHAYASPAYLKRAPPLRRPEDLKEHSCLIFSNVYDGSWTLERATPKSVHKVSVRGRFTANNLIALRRLAVDGRGVAMLPAFFCQEDIEKKRLVQVLEGWATRRHPVSIVYPHQSFVPKNTRALIDHISEFLKDVF